MSQAARERIMSDFDRWGFDQRGWGQTTRRRYYATARRADLWLVEHRKTSLLWAKPRDLQAFLFSTAPNARSRNNVRQCLVGFGDYLVAKGYADSNPAASLPRLREPALLPRPIANAAARRIEAVAPTFGPMVRSLVLLCLYAGLRRDEARLLQWSSVGEDGWLRFTGKRDRERAIPLHPTVAAALTAWRRECPSAEWVFPSERRPGQPVSPTWTNKVIREVGETAGVELKTHALRHTAATRLLEKVGDVRVVQEFLGHASLSTTQIYTKVRPVRLEGAVDALDYEGD